jgi:hypothetical protein
VAGVIGLRVISAAGLLTFLVAADAGAQYFGRNKVEYVDFEFRVLQTRHFDVYYYNREEAAARVAAQLAERWYARFSRLLNHELDGRQPLILYGSQPEFAQTNVVSGLLSDTVGGVTESARRRIVMPFAPTLTETNRVLGHEIAHAFQFDIARRHGGGLSLPLWFVEGMAEYLARGADDPEARVWLRDAVLSERLPLRQHDAARRLSPYQYGHAFWAYLGRRFGDEVVAKMLKPEKKRGKLRDRMTQSTGVELDQLYADWRRAAHDTYGLSPSEAEAWEARVFSSDTSGRVHLGPALSPDGRHVVFFSERDRLSLDLFLADTGTGRIIRKLATTTATARFDSLQPLRSAGAWSLDGERFVFAAVRQGHATLVFPDMRGIGGESSKPAAPPDREIHLPELGQILTVSWSPDARSLTLSALAGGFSNLYLYDLASGRLRQLTDDAYADLHPSWSPNGREIAFATDRYSTDLAELTFGPSRLALIDVQSGIVRPVTAPLDAVSYINPQWSPDARSLYFVAHAGGISNVFRSDLADQTVHQVTHVASGVSGLTPTSPSLSVAVNAPVLAFTVYRDGRHQLALLDGPRKIAGRHVETVSTAPALLATSATPVPSEPRGLLEQLLQDSRTGLPDASSMDVHSYVPQFALERIGQPYLSSGSGAFGTFVRGGGSLLFGDVLAERRLGAAVQVANHLRDVAFETRFLNQASRWNWGAIAELEPASRRYRLTRTVEHEGQPALLRQADYLQRTQLRLSGLVAYPFSRGLRVEFLGGVRHARYYRDLRSRVSSVATGRILGEAREELSGGEPTTVAEVGAALVGDYTVFGPTGPVIGSRYRLEISPAVGGLTYTGLLADYRRYLMPVKPYTLAMRLIHSGRYGRDGDEQRLLPSSLGSRYSVRGHWRDAHDCRPDSKGACGSELLGSRLAAASMEWRAPVWGLFSRQLEYGPLPMDAFVFADGGVVWSAVRTFVSSVGAGIRVNAGGLPFEFGAVRALDGPARGWSTDFGFRTGF